MLASLRLGRVPLLESPPRFIVRAVCSAPACFRSRALGMSPASRCPRECGRENNCIRISGELFFFFFSFFRILNMFLTFWFSRLCLCWSRKVWRQSSSPSLSHWESSVFPLPRKGKLLECRQTLEGRPYSSSTCSGWLRGCCFQRPPRFVSVCFNRTLRFIFYNAELEVFRSNKGMVAIKDSCSIIACHF